MQNNQVGDFSWYLFGTMVPILLNFIKNPIFTRYFTPEEYGYFSLVFLTFNYCSLTLFSWLSSNIWRYYYQYKNKNQLDLLFSNIGGLYLVGSAILVIITFFWYTNTNSLLVRKIIMFTFLYYLLNDITSLYLVMIRLEKKSREYNLIQSLRAIINFLLLFFFAYIISMRIEAMALSFLLSTFIIIVYIIHSSYRKYSFFIPSLKLFSINSSKVFLTYGIVGLLTNLTMLILNNSDRYFIALFYTIDDVGVYNQNYNIAQTSIFALTMAFMNTINPVFNRQLTENIKNSAPLMSRLMFYYLLIMTPITFILFFFSKELDYILLGPGFREGYVVLSYVSVSLFIYGFVNFSETKLKFKNKFRIVVMAFILACSMNILLNYFLLRVYDYTWAAKSTLFAFLLLYLILSIFDWESTIDFYRTYYREMIIMGSAISILVLLNGQTDKVLPNTGNIVFKIIQIILNLSVLYGIGFILFMRRKRIRKS